MGRGSDGAVGVAEESSAELELEVGVMGGGRAVTMLVILLAEADMTLGSLHTEEGEATSAMAEERLTAAAAETLEAKSVLLTAGSFLTG